MKSQEESERFARGTLMPQVIPELAEERETRNDDAPASIECDSDELPQNDEETRVVLLPVNPHLVHVYWEVAAPDMKEVVGILSRRGPRAHPVLRFHDTSRMNSDGSNGSGWFEVEIALGAGSWYVRLESPARSYCVDLGLGLKGGEFLLLARSDVAEIPRASPSNKSEERYLLLADDESRTEVVVAPGEGKGASRRAAPFAAPQGGEGKWREGGEPSPFARADVELQGGKANWQDDYGASQSRTRYDQSHREANAKPSPVPAADGHTETMKTAQRWTDVVRAACPDLSGSRPLSWERPAPAHEPVRIVVRSGSDHRTSEIGDARATAGRAGAERSEAMPAPQFSEQEPQETTFLHTARVAGTERKLAEFYQQPIWDRSCWAPEPEDRGGSQPSGDRGPDLTEVSERSFRAGLSSGQKSS